jgi:hypothetical protein
MIALAGNFHILASRITAHLAAVLLAVRDIAPAWNMRAHFLLFWSTMTISPIYTVLDTWFSDRVSGSYSQQRCALYMVIAIRIPSRGDKRSGVLLKGSDKGIANFG